MSPCGFLGVACIVSYLSTAFRQVIYSIVYQSPLPDELKCHGLNTFATIVVYGLAVVIENRYTPTAMGVIACLASFDLDICYTFHSLLRPKILSLMLRDCHIQASECLMSNY
jgi:hypothetical protein